MAIGKGDKFVNTIIRAGGADVLDLDAEGGGNAWWWLVFDGREFGPLSTSAVTQLCLSGVVRPDTPVRSNRFAQHVPASTLRALRTLLTPIAADEQAAETALAAMPSAPLKVKQESPFAPLAMLAERRTVLVALCLCAGAVLLGVMCLTLFKPQRAAAARDAVQQHDAAGGQPVAPGSAEAPASPREPARSATETDESRLKRVVLAYVRASAGAYQRYDQSIRALNIHEVWKPDRLANAATYPEARRRCDTVRAALAKLGQELDRAQADVTKRARASGAAPEAQELFLAEYATHRDAERAAYRAFAARETKLLGEIEGLLEFLEVRARSGAVSSRGGRIMFRHPADHDECNARLQRVVALAGQ